MPVVRARACEVVMAKGFPGYLQLLQTKRVENVVRSQQSAHITHWQEPR